ncbi:kinase-like domain-containing protein [Rhizophagus irregularis DAOM 181602=DAOM 197198]|uniref:non-specific serine/threonine protein kinase n=1 Tax=Rhizophagus irregularis (strain DAOM 181602 / DAOM 197198 / MUCL 43194) TaxID=747089 RepID=A0A2P4QJ27_RHIID|nr:kinase-like domain-containing protein [Rhizophagus irregularis DAOM 181602=DAOM 197198]POG77652.1 kinase-like domain-containing protein [Rhizophagus irregularis DAOM 181602=DAOM 197198]GBC33909.2 kinase-like domain-containing protein [Rhizophagus irregularis DAOM 181602=DAOM 197198]|eukprot:XP_025184518.1 kinase-like domain-containing protein [Rhizophagus irregularis DAOM 181602=DAOM 197198]
MGSYGICKECEQENTGYQWCITSINHYRVLKWIPYNKFYDIEYTAKGGFGKYIKQNGLTDIFIIGMKIKWKRFNSNEIVALKIYGITRDPEKKNYMMVLQYAEVGSSRNYLNKYYSKLDWTTKLFYLWHIAYGLETIHERELIHRDLHIGNILEFIGCTSITDMGLCKPADYNSSENSKNRIYDVLPYVAPEI